MAAVPAGAIAIATHPVPWPAARHELATLGPTVGFLASVLVLAHLADAEGMFRFAGAVTARIGRGTPMRLLGVVFAVAAVVTAVRSLDATVVLLTPVVFVTAAPSGVRARPYVYACTHLANSASLLLPVSNLTNLLAFTASGLADATGATGSSGRRDPSANRQGVAERQRTDMAVPAAGPVLHCGGAR